MHRGFTLIEMLIVVAIVAVLAAIAVPNSEEARERAKVSRCKADLRTVAAALESYKADWTKFPFDGASPGGTMATRGYNYWYLPKDLSTPVAYVTSVSFVDPYRLPAGPANWQARDIRYTSVEQTWGTEWDEANGRPIVNSVYYPMLKAEYGSWKLDSVGPDRANGPGGWDGVAASMGYPATQVAIPYDATNGTFSLGDIIRTQASASGYAGM